jgi:phosphoribosyl-ATP pyrophosphohydrolase
VLAARDLDPERSRTARLFRRGQAKMAKKLAEEAIEVVIDAVNGRPDAVVRESADLLYNLMVVWVAAGVKPEDVWAEMDRREKMLGIAEKLPKADQKTVQKASGKVSRVASPAARKAAVAARRRPAQADANRARARKRR